VIGGPEGYCFVDSIYGSVDRSRDSPRWIPDEPEWGGLPEWDGGGDGRRWAGGNMGRRAGWVYRPHVPVARARECGDRRWRQWHGSCTGDALGEGGGVAWLICV
jgi:hypothetical protein